MSQENPKKRRFVPYRFDDNSFYDLSSPELGFTLRVIGKNRESEEDKRKSLICFHHVGNFEDSILPLERLKIIQHTGLLVVLDGNYSGRKINQGNSVIYRIKNNSSGRITEIPEKESKLIDDYLDSLD